MIKLENEILKLYLSGNIKNIIELKFLLKEEKIERKETKEEIKEELKEELKQELIYFNKHEIKEEIKEEISNIYQKFLSECTEFNNKHITTTKLYESFTNLCHNNNVEIPNIRNFIKGINNFIKIEYVKIDNRTKYGTKNLKIK